MISPTAADKEFRCKGPLPLSPEEAAAAAAERAAAAEAERIRLVSAAAVEAERIRLEAAVAAEAERIRLEEEAAEAERIRLEEEAAEDERIRLEEEAAEAELWHLMYAEPTWWMTDEDNFNYVNTNDISGSDGQEEEECDTTDLTDNWGDGCPEYAHNL